MNARSSNACARYITRPAVSTERLSLTAQGHIRYRLKTPYRDGTTDVVFEPLDFMARLAALVPGPRVNLTRYHGSSAPSGRFSRSECLPSSSLGDRVWPGTVWCAAPINRPLYARKRTHKCKNTSLLAAICQIKFGFLLGRWASARFQHHAWQHAAHPD